MKENRRPRGSWGKRSCRVGTGRGTQGPEERQERVSSGTRGILKHLCLPQVFRKLLSGLGPEESSAATQEAWVPVSGTSTSRPRTLSCGYRDALGTEAQTLESPSFVLPFALGTEGKLCLNTPLVKQIAFNHGEEKSLGKGENRFTE